MTNKFISNCAKLLNALVIDIIEHVFYIRILLVHNWQHVIPVGYRWC